MAAWRCSGTTNTELITNLYRAQLITHESIRDAMLAVDRAHYAPHSPYQDSPQPIGHAATISAPHMHAYACSYLLPSLRPGAKVLDVGSGSGYLCAVLANLVGESGKVVGIDHISSLVSLAEQNMSKSASGRAMLESGRVKFVVGDGRLGYKEEAPYDAIHVGAAAKDWHEELTSQLKVGGSMFIPVGEGSQAVWLVQKGEDGTLKKERLMDVMYVPLTDHPDS